MAYFSLHAYDADAWIHEFKGINQADAEINADPRFAVEAENVETPLGVLQPHAGYDLVEGGFEGNKIETIASFYRRWTSDTEKEWLVAAVGGHLYYRPVNGSDGWKSIDMPTGVIAFQSNVWSYVTYEINSLGDVAFENPVDVLLMSNAEDGMIMVVPPDHRITWGDIAQETWGDLKTMTWAEAIIAPDWQIVMVDTRSDPTNDEEPQKKFGVIERHAERIWGSGVKDYPDTIYYSAAYKPLDWRPYPYYDPDDPECDPEDPDTWIGQPEDGAGDVMQPSWDGDKFTVLKSFGNQLLAFKGRRVWRIVGVSPGEYTFTEQFGGGTLYPNTVAVDVERVFLADNDGISYYDGMSVKSFIREQIQALWRRVNRSAIDQMCAVLFKEKYYLALPIDGSAVNNALLVYNKDEQSILLYTDVHIESLVAAGDVLYATSSVLPGQLLILKYNSWIEGDTTGAPTKWVSPWMDFGRKSIQKGGYEVYFTPEVRGAPMTFRFSIQTEKKTKTKIVTVQTSTFKAKQRRIRFGGTGRRFRLIIETGSAPKKTTWRLIGGIQMVVEIDPD